WCRIIRPSLRNGFNGLFSRSPRGPGSFAPVISGSLRQLDASVGASGPPDFPVRGTPFEKAARRVWYQSAEALAKADQRRSSAPPPRPLHPAPRFVTIAHTPLLPRRDGANTTTDLGFGKSEIFLRKGLDRE